MLRELFVFPAVISAERICVLVHVNSDIDYFCVLCYIVHCSAPFCMRQVMLVVFYSKFTTEPSILQTLWHYILTKLIHNQIKRY